MKNKGFTLVELIAVLAILALIALITIPVITDSLKSYKNSLYENQIKQIELAASVWASDNLMILPNDTNSTSDPVEIANIATAPDNYKTLLISIGTLQSGGYIDTDIKNIKTKELYSTDMKIAITKNGNKLEYNLIEQTYLAFEVGDKVVTQVSGSETREFYVIENSGIYSKTVKLISSDSLTTTSTWNNVNNVLANLDWSNKNSLRLIKVSEINNIGGSPTWFYNGTSFWANDSDASNQLNAYYINNSTLSTQVKTNTSSVRPLIEIDKDFVTISNS